MFRPVKATTIEEYFDLLPPDRREMVDFLHKFIQKTAPSLKSFFAYNMLGYGVFKYKNYKKELIDWPVIALANQKNYISIYICSMQGNEYVAEKYKEKLGRVSVGKSCIRFKKLTDINLDELEKVIKIAENSPGLISDF